MKRPHPIITTPIVGGFSVYCVSVVPAHARIVTAAALVLMFLVTLATLVCVCIEWVEAREKRIREVCEAERKPWLRPQYVEPEDDEA